MPHDKPAWLSRTATGGERQHFQKRTPQVGDVCMVESSDGSLRRLCFVFAVEESRGLAQVALLASEVEFGGSTEVVVSRKDTGLPYDLLLHCDLVGPVWLTQIRGCHLFAAEVLPPVLIRSCLSGVPSGEVSPAGRALVGPADTRIRFKQAELQQLHHLVRECLTRMVDGAILDPEIFCRRMTHEPIQVRAALCEGLLSGDLRIDARALEELGDPTTYAFASDPDLWLALEPVWNSLVGFGPQGRSAETVGTGKNPIDRARAYAIANACADGRALLFIASLDKQFADEPRASGHGTAACTVIVEPIREA